MFIGYNIKIGHTIICECIFPEQECKNLLTFNSNYNVTVTSGWSKDEFFEILFEIQIISIICCSKFCKLSTALKVKF